MTVRLPSLEEPWPGATCGTCGDELRLVGFCASCHEREMQPLEAPVPAAAELRQAAVEADHAEARRRARTWQLAQAVQV
jgi:cytochrome c553